MILGILFGALVLIATSYGFFNFGGSDAKHSYVPVLVLTGMFSVMFVALSVYIYRNYKVSSIKNWPYVQGNITDSKVSDEWNGTFIEIEYSYFINDVHYMNNDFDYFSKRASLGQLFLLPGLRNTDSLYDFKNKLVRVYYKPSSPYTSYISCNLVQNPLVVLLPSIIIITSSLFLFLRILQVN